MMVMAKTVEAVDNTGTIRIEAGKARVITGHQITYLSASEMAILHKLYRARGNLVPVTQLEDAIYEQPGCEEIMGEIKYHIRNLRRKLGDYDRSLIYCRRHLGYGLEIERICWIDKD